MEYQVLVFRIFDYFGDFAAMEMEFFIFLRLCIEILQSSGRSDINIKDMDISFGILLPDIIGLLHGCQAANGRAVGQVIFISGPRTLNETELADLLAQSIAYRMGRLSFGAYYQNLRTLCESKGINLRNTPAFDDYIRYVLLSDGIKPDDLFAAVGELEDTIKSLGGDIGQEE